MKKSLIILVSMVFILSLGGAASAALHSADGNPGDTPADTEIYGSDNFVEYKDVVGNTKETVESNDVTDVTSAEHGFSNTNLPSDLTLYSAPGGAISWVISITNEGNADETLTATKEGFIYTGGASNWAVTFTHGGGDTSEVVTELSDDDDEFITLTLTPSSEENESPDGSKGSIEAWVYVGLEGPDTGGEEEGRYTGANNFSYGGHTLTSDIYQVDIMAPVMTILKTATMDAPTSSEAYYTDGNIHAAIPGSLWIFMIVYDNSGSGTAESVVIYDKVPDNCWAYKANVQDPEADGRIILADNDIDTTSDWSRYYSTSATPNWGYGASGWTADGSSGSESSGVLPKDVVWYKWENASVAAGDNEDLQWSVEIK